MASIFSGPDLMTSEVSVETSELSIPLVKIQRSFRNSSTENIADESNAILAQTQDAKLAAVSKDPESPGSCSAVLRLVEQYNLSIMNSDSQCTLINGRSSVESFEKLESAEPVPVEDSRKTFSSLRLKYGSGVYGFWKAFSVHFSDSLYMIPLQITLLGMMISAFFMGIANRFECPMSLLIPLLLLSMGLLGIITAYIRIAFVIYRYRVPCGRCDGPRCIVYFVNYLFFVAYLTEMSCYLERTPSFKPEEENYCNPYFYIYICWMNWATLILIILVIIIHGPAFLERLFGRNVDEL